MPNGWNFVNGSMPICNCIDTSSSVMRLNLPATVSITLAFHICGHKWTLTPLWKAMFNVGPVSMCDVVLDNQLIGPFIFEGRLTGDTDLRFLQDELPSLLDDVPLATWLRKYFQHDGATPHFSSAVEIHLDYRFPGRWIGRAGAQNWPPRPPDLNHLDYYLWWRMKTLVY
jgi:hypothetical protein